MSRGVCVVHKAATGGEGEILAVAPSLGFRPCWDAGGDPSSAASGPKTCLHSVSSWPFPLTLYLIPSLLFLPPSLFCFPPAASSSESRAVLGRREKTTFQF